MAASLVPRPSAFAYYGIFFVFGWMLFRSRDLLPAVESRPWIKLAVAVPAGLLAYFFFAGIIELPGILPVAPTILIISGVAAWSSMFAVWGIFARFLSGAEPWVRYLADASYWIYLIHIPILVAIQLGLADTGLPPAIRLVIATSVSIALSFATYATLVRYTAIGRLLHGPRKRPTGVPARVGLVNG